MPESIPVESDEKPSAVRQTTFINTIDRNANEIQVLQKSGINYATDVLVQTVTNGDSTHAPSGDAVFDFGNSLIVQTITDGDTAHTPSADAVFDALALIDTPQHVVKGSDQIYNANVLTDDTALFFTVAANGVYEVVGTVFQLASTASSPGKISMSLPSGTFSGTLLIVDSGSDAYMGFAVPGTASNTEVSFTSFSTASSAMPINFRVAVGGTGGTVTFRFKDDTDADTLTVKAGSWITARKVA